MKKSIKAKVKQLYAARDLYSKRDASAYLNTARATASELLNVFAEEYSKSKNEKARTHIAHIARILNVLSLNPFFHHDSATRSSQQCEEALKQLFLLLKNIPSNKLLLNEIMELYPPLELPR